MNCRIFLVFISVFFILPAQAVPVNGLYSADIDLPVTRPESQMLTQAFGLAAERVLIKVSGNQKAITGDVLRQAKKLAPNWVAQHSVTALSELLPQGDGFVTGKRTSVTFYQESIDRFLSQNNLPVWGNNRPSVLVWLASETNGVRRLSGSNAPSVLLNDFAVTASDVGIPIYAPLLDEVDQRNLAASDVWGLFEDNIRQASQRYQTDSIAAIKVNEYPGYVSGNLLVMLKNGESERVTLTGETTKAILDQASLSLASVFSSRYASVRSDTSTKSLTVQVAGIPTFQVLNKIQSYLESISVVRDVAVAVVEGQRVEFVVSIDGDKQKLFNSISLSRLLLSAPLNALDPDANRIVSYQYSGV
ncbi:DUF2066 domain-containing protein [Marinomonas algarum]|uniref:DUF2066 domain-containing protein n=1 Tax=Marinomonas algarum TaxID=2883105 RepID=A0A9X1IMX4_9GAMM|nr:DUF2066 domain-containing protein [Marinomonas algarum]MCB5162168.1 DUF2066 domain-containing protein [Marinomonas algarum]